MRLCPANDSKLLIGFPNHSSVNVYVLKMETPELLVVDVRRWRSWLEKNHQTSSGVFLILAKKGTDDPTSLRYDEALEEALCFGWIDGKLERRDEKTYRQRFTPRTSRSNWSQRNVAIVERLLGADRVHDSGKRVILEAKESGRWDAAYAGQASTTIPEDFQIALEANPSALRAYERLSKANRFSMIYRIENAKRRDTRERHVRNFVDMLARGETPHPQKRSIID